MHRLALAVAALLSLCSACSSSKTTSASNGGAAPLDAGVGVDGTDPEDAGVDATVAETGSDAAVDGASGGCVVKRAATSSACAEDCDARLTLPAGGTYCSAQCTRNDDCAAYGSDLICPDTIGACVPRCTDNASCTAGGFARCDTATGGCDTL